MAGNRHKHPKGDATVVGIGARAELQFAVVRDGVAIDRLVVAIPDGASLYSPADLRRWLSQAEKQVAQKLAELNASK